MRSWWFLLGIWAAVGTGLAPAPVVAEDPAGPDDGAELDEADVEGEMDASGFASLRGDKRAEAIRRMFANPGPNHVRDLSSVLKSDFDSQETEQRAFEILKGLGGDQLVPVGRALLKHPILYKWIMGVRLLGASRSGKAIPPLLEAAESGMASGSEPRYHLSCALADLGDPRALPWLRKTAPEDRFARLALGSLGDRSVFPQILRDYDADRLALDELLHNLDVMAPFWTKAQRLTAEKDATVRREFLARFHAFLPELDAPHIREIAAYLTAQPTSPLSDLLHAEVASLVARGRGAAFLPLLDAPIPELQRETACALAQLDGPATQPRILETLRTKGASPSIHDRALLLRVLGLFPEADRPALAIGGLKDSSGYVVVEALKAILALRLRGVGPVLEEVRQRPRYASDARIQQLCTEASTFQ